MFVHCIQGKLNHSLSHQKKKKKKTPFPYSAQAVEHQQEMWAVTARIKTKPLKFDIL